MCNAYNSSSYINLRQINIEMIEEKEVEQAAKDIASNMFDNWLNDLEEKEQPQACSIDNPDCENCGS